MLFSSRVGVRIGVRIRFSVWLVNCYAHVFALLSVVIVTLPRMVDTRSQCRDMTMAPAGASAISTVSRHLKTELSNASYCVIPT